MKMDSRMREASGRITKRHLLMIGGAEADRRGSSPASTIKAAFPRSTLEFRIKQLGIDKFRHGR
jgi:hypothetical protein